MEATTKAPECKHGHTHKIGQCVVTMSVYWEAYHRERRLQRAETPHVNPSEKPVIVLCVCGRG